MKLHKALLCDNFKYNANLSNIRLLDQYFNFCQSKRSCEAQSLNKILGARQLNLSEIDFTKEKSLFKFIPFLEGINLENSNLSKANLTGLDLTNANLRGANLEDANLQRSNLRNADLENATLKGSDLRNTNLEEAHLKNTNLTNIKYHLDILNLFTTYLQSTNKKEYFSQQTQQKKNYTDFYFKLLTSQMGIVEDICDQNLNNITISYLNLTGYNFSGCQLKGGKLINAQLYKTNLSKIYFENVDLAGANLKFADLENATLKNVNLRGADLQYATLINTRLEKCNLEYANLEHATLENVEFHETNLKKINLKGTNLVHQLNKEYFYSKTQTQTVTLPSNSLLIEKLFELWVSSKGNNKSLHQSLLNSQCNVDFTWPNLNLKHIYL